MPQPLPGQTAVLGPRRHQRLLRLRLQRPGQRADADRALHRRDQDPGRRRLRRRSCPRSASRWCWATSTTPTWPAGWPRKESRDDVTAMPYGPSVPHMFIVVFVIMLPIYLKTKDPLLAWEAGIAWAFIIGVIVLIGAFVGPYIRKYAPRAAMLGTLAGISITFISMSPAGADVGGAVDRAAGLRPDPDRPAHRRQAARQHPDRPGRAAGRHRDRLDRRLHVRAGRDRRGQGHRVRLPAPEDRPARSTACGTSPRCWPPRSRSASTTSPRR